MPKKSLFQFRSVKFEISIIYTLVLAVILFIFSGVIYVILSQTLYAQFDNEVTITANQVSNNIRMYLEFKGSEPEALIYALEKTIASKDKTQRRWWHIGFERSWFKRLDEQELGRNDYINFVSPEGISLIHSENISEPLLKLFLSDYSLSDGKEKMYYLSHEGKRIRVINYPFQYQEGQTYILQVGISPEPVIQLLHNWMNRVVLSIPLFLILTSMIGRLLASRILRPVKKITDMANTISHEDLNKRVEVQNFYTEMNSLVQSFNNMISRLEKSFKHIEQFSAYMAHEIKTPLSIMKGEAELALLTKRNIEEYQGALKINLEEIDKMLKIVDDLLFLTKMDYQPGCFKLERVNLLEYFREIYEQSIFLVKEKNIDIKYEPLPQNTKIFIKADPLHLRRLFFNLIDNAIKFTSQQGKITLKMQKGQRSVSIAIADTGKGIASDEKQKIFERFYRADNQEAGSGLGLSIAQSIAKLHGGRIDVESQLNKGSIFSVTLPTI
jgi:heavy metal sensor kinase